MEHIVGIHPILAPLLLVAIPTPRRELLSSISLKVAPEEEALAEGVQEEAEVEEVLVVEGIPRHTYLQLQG